MTRIGATISGIERQLLRYLNDANTAAARHAIRLASGQRINKPADDPSAFLQISKFERQLGLVNTTSGNIDAAANLAAEAQLTLDQIRTQLNTIRTALVADEDRSLTAEERAEKQAEIDAAIAQINELAKTPIEGRGLLDGSSNYRLSGRNSAQVSSVQVYATRATTISGSVTSAATQGTLTYTGLLGNTTSSATFTLTGERGATTVTVTAGQALTDVAEGINNDSHKTGISASVVGSTLTLSTVNYGTRATLAVDVTSGTFNVTGGNGDGTAEGTDVAAIINGRTFSGGASVDGNKLTYSQNGLHFTIDFAAGFSGALSDIEISESSIRKFALTPDPAALAKLGLPGVQAAQLRGVSGSVDQLLSGGSLSGLDGNTSQAIRVVDEALESLSLIEGRVDGFADAAVASSAALMDDLATNLEETLASVNGIDEDEEELLISKNQTLASNTLAALSAIGQQRSSLLDLLKQIAGL